MSFIDQINFTTAIRPIYDANGRMVPTDMARGIYREDTDELISLAGSNFKAIDHMEVVRPILKSLEDEGYDVEQRENPGHALYDLVGKKGAWISGLTDGNGAVMRMEIITGDFIEVTGRGGYLREGPDTFLRQITVLNSHNGTLALRTMDSWKRLKCANGMVDERWTASTYAKHTSGVNVEALKAKIANGLKMMAGDKEKFARYCMVKVSIPQAETFFRKTLAKLAPKANGTENWSDPLVEQLLQLFRREPVPNAFALWNAMTAWSTHGKMKANASELTGRLGREGRVASAMRSREWRELIAA